MTDRGNACEAAWPPNDKNNRAPAIAARETTKPTAIAPLQAWRLAGLLQLPTEELPDSFWEMEAPVAQITTLAERVDVLLQDYKPIHALGGVRERT
jgi:hypothetical protein